jgi:maltose/maltodextrin transport system permease protein
MDHSWSSGFKPSSLREVIVATMRRASPYRYLAPGLIGIAVLALLPMLYTVWLGFTNYSAAHLLTFERATEAMLGETFQASSTRYQFSLHSDGVAFRIILRTSDDDTATDNTVNVADRSAFVSPPLPLIAAIKIRIAVAPLAGAGFVPGEPLPLREISARADAIRALTFALPDGTTAAMSGLREMSPYEPLYQKNADGTLTNRRDHVRLTADFATGFYETADGKPAQPGFRTSVGFHNYVQVFTEDRFRGPFLRVFAWTSVFAALTVVLCTGLGLLLAELLTWKACGSPPCIACCCSCPMPCPASFRSSYSRVCSITTSERSIKSSIP